MRPIPEAPGFFMLSLEEIAQRQKLEAARNPAGVDNQGDAQVVEEMLALPAPEGAGEGG